MLLSLMIEEVICNYYRYSHSDSRSVSPSCLSLTGKDEAAAVKWS